MKEWALLSVAIIAELVGTASLKWTDGLARPLAWLGVLGGYGTAFWLLSLVIKKLDLGVTYALWSGFGIVFAVLVGVIWFGETVTWMRLVGIAAIVLGIVVIELDGSRAPQEGREEGVMGSP